MLFMIELSVFTRNEIFENNKNFVDFSNGFSFHMYKYII